MVDDAGTARAPAAYRGFLFSDMRGFTSFAERHGNAAAAAAVGRFLELARAAIARHDGSEVGTEGDAIHAVFPSASSAVLCGLEIVEAAAELNANEPDKPIQLGVGVHAGEAVETAEGYIGRAVNLAARLCAAARPGEVLVSSTVKGITHASIPVGFIPRGRRRLKGIADPIQVYAVTRDPNAKAPREIPRGLLLGGAGAVIAVAILAVVALGTTLLGVTPGTSPATSAGGPVAQPVTMGPLGIGAYRSQQFQPAIEFEILDLGWTANRDTPQILSLVRDEAPRGGIQFLRVDAVIESPCILGGEGATGPAAIDVIGELSKLTGHLKLSANRSVEVGGLTGRQVDVNVDDGALAACAGLAGADVALFAVGDEVFGATPGERFRLVTVDVGQDVVTIPMSLDWTQTHSVQELEDFLGLAQRVLDSVEF